MEHSKSKAVASNLRQERSRKFERSVSASNVYFFWKKQNHFDKKPFLLLLHSGSILSLKADKRQTMIVQFV